MSETTSSLTPARFTGKPGNGQAFVICERTGGSSHYKLAHLYDGRLSLCNYRSPGAAHAGDKAESSVGIELDTAVKLLEKLGYVVARPGEGLDLRSATDQEILDLAGVLDGDGEYSPLGPKVAAALRARMIEAQTAAQV